MITSLEFYIVALPAVILVGLSKGGFQGISMISIPLMALVVPPLQAAAIMLPVLLVQDVVSVWAYRRTWDTGNLAVLLPSGAAGVLAAYLFAAEVSVAGVQLALGLFSVLFGLQQLVVHARSANAPAERRGTVLGVICGAAAGFTSAISHAGAPPFQFYVMPQRLARDVFVGTGVMFFAAINLLKVPSYLALGQISRDSMLTGATLMPVAIASTWAGVLLVRRTSGDVFVKIIYFLLVLVGLKLMWDGISGLGGPMPSGA